jgi:putative ABC transport system permease protein
MLVCLLGIALGELFSLALMWGAQDLLRVQFGVLVQPGWPSEQAWLSLAALSAVAMLASVLPAWQAYRLSLMDGLHPPAV